MSVHTTRMEAGSRENLVNTHNLLWGEEYRLLGETDNGVLMKTGTMPRVNA